MPSNYGDTSIQNNEGPKGLRKRPATLLGTGGLSGCVHAIFEIVSNSVDEYREGYGDVITVTVDDDNSVTVEDRGRGVPMDWNSKANKYNWDLVFNTLYASGKGSGSAYSTSEGLNGVGCTAAQYTSDYMEVSVVRESDDGRLMRYEMSFKDGYPVGELRKKDITGSNVHTGTKVKFRPSASVFNVNNVESYSYSNRLRKKAMTTPGLKIVLKYKGDEPQEFYFKDGMKEYIDNNTASARWNKEVLYFEKERTCNDLYYFTGQYDAEKNFKGESRLALAFVKDSEYSVMEVYHNGAILSQGGETLNSVITACAKVFTQAGLDEGKLQKGEKISVRDIDGVLAVCGETRCPGEYSDFENQTKVALRNPSLISLVEDNTTEGLVAWRGRSPKEFDKVLDEIIINKNARDKADSIKKSQLKKLTSDIHKIGNEPEKLLPAKLKDPEKCEIFIIEGDSAKGSVASARDGNYQAIFPLRGKIPNCLKNSFETLLRSEIIINLLTILGCGIQTKSKYIKDLPEFSLSNLNYNKIILTTDADVDGGHITCLLLIFFMKFVPGLIRKGHVYIALSPLFFIHYKGKKYYAYSDEERDVIVSNLIANGATMSSIIVSRAKGLGEIDEDDMYDTVLNPETRKLIQVQFPEDDEKKMELMELCEQLLGNDLESRRELIKEYFDSVVAIEE